MFEKAHCWWSYTNFSQKAWWHGDQNSNSSRPILQLLYPLNEMFLDMSNAVSYDRQASLCCWLLETRLHLKRNFVCVTELLDCKTLKRLVCRPYVWAKTGYNDRTINVFSALKSRGGLADCLFPRASACQLWTIVSSCSAPLIRCGPALVNGIK
jgi:ubiquitin C-terminal hydrolase